MDFKFPDVGEGITEGKLVKWHVKEGDSIKSEQTVASIETDKAVVDIPSPTTGVVEKLFFKSGDVVEVGKVLMSINNGGIQASSQAQSIPVPQKVSLQPTELVSKPTVVQTQSYIPQNNYQSTNNVSNNNSNSGTILAMPQVRKFAHEKNIDLSNVHGSGAHGQILLNDIGNATGTVQAIQRQTTTFSQTVQTSRPLTTSNFNGPIQSFNDVLATPSTRMLARKMGIDLTKIKGTGDNGMIIKGDLARSNSSQENVITSISPINVATRISAPINFTSTQTNPIESVPMSMIRQIISKRMFDSIQSTAQYTVMDEVDVTELVKAREKYKEAYEKQGTKLTYLAFITKAVVLALQKHPYVNATMDEANKQLLIKHYYNIGIATDTPDGLKVPVVKGSEHKNILQIAVEIADLASRAKNKTIKLDEMNDGTFTISSLGNNFGQGFTPIINYPETAIMGIGRIIEKPVIFNGQIVPRKIITLSLTADHRLVDGAEASRFMNDVKSYLEDLNALLLELS